MDQETRNKLQRATQQIRRLLEDEFTEQLEGTYDILPNGKILESPGKHLNARERLVRRKIIEAIEHIKANGKKSKDAVEEYTREAAFTFLNRFVALRMLEARGMLQECVSKGDASSGFKEFYGLAPGLNSLDDGGYRLYLECLFDELSVEVKVLFDRRDSASMLWPRRGALTELLEILGQADLTGVWSEDETIGWVYQYFNSGDERKKMREESSAPRNSRELAVRNQFFTPRYVVEFLTDNTLGRIWYEMRKGQTRLVDECSYLVRRSSEVFLNEGQDPPPDDSNDNQDLSQEQLLKKTVYIPHRPKQDPRDLKILDPACGSGHFLLYAFDLLISIYEEAWHDEASATSAVTEQRLRDDYSDLKQLHAALPALVLAHNLHGIDIDPRAAQIAALALWMRGQRAFNEFQIARDHRAAITRSNIVCAEPMPGEVAFLEEFITEHLSEHAEDRFLASLVQKVFEAMELAGEAGSLLKIEEDIAEEVAKAKKKWLERPEYRQQTLFDDSPRTVQKELDLTRGITDESFWEEVEQQIYEALRTYSEQAERSGGFQRRLFATDTATGFGFIDLSRQRYDVVLMNPPFGKPSKHSKESLITAYPAAYSDMFTMFVIRAIGLLNNGMLGAITSRTAFFIGTSENWRDELRKQGVSPIAFADLGDSVLDSAMVETAAYCLSVGRNTSSTFIRVIGSDDKEASLRQRISQIISGDAATNGVYEARMCWFDSIPGSPYAYWTTDRVRNLFEKFEPMESSERFVRVGLQTSNDFRFLRLWWEVPQVAPNPEVDLETLWSSRESLRSQFAATTKRGKRWVTFAKGGEFGRYYFDQHLVVNWEFDGTEIKHYTLQIGNSSWSRNVRSPEFYFVPGVTWTGFTTSPLSVRALPANAICGHVAPTAYCNDREMLLAILAIKNSRVYAMLTDLSMGLVEGGRKVYGVGVDQRIPVPELKPEQKRLLASLAQEQFSLALAVDRANETSHAFTGIELEEADSLAQIYTSMTTFTVRASERQEQNQVRIERIALEVYGLSSSDMRNESFDDSNAGEQSVDCEGRNLKKMLSKAKVAGRVASSLFGIAVGRWSLGSANPTRLEDPDIFAPLPVCSPAMAQSPQGLHLLLTEPAFPTNVQSLQSRGILTDDEGHELDFEKRILEIGSSVARESFDNIQRELCRSLGVNCLRDYYRKEFFADHIRQYSKSRRKAPIYWQLATPTASYSAWIYYHSFTKDTFFNIAGLVKDKLKHEQQKLDRVTGEAGAEPSRSQRKEIEDQERFVTELSSMVEEVERIAPLWNPNLNDGVIINFAPLWRLVPQNKSWQKECKSCWNKLVKGDYDWAHLAMHLWPERVVPKCTTDASLAIAHGLEDAFWVQDERERFQPKEEPSGGWKSVVDRLVKERTSPAVKAALQSLLDAPVPSSSGRSRRTGS